MRVRVKTWSGSQEMELATYLTPEGSSYGAGQIESVQSDTRATAEAVGRLLEKLVETRALTLDEAGELAGRYGDVEFITEH